MVFDGAVASLKIWPRDTDQVITVEVLDTGHLKWYVYNTKYQTYLNAQEIDCIKQATLEWQRAYDHNQKQRRVA